MCNLIKLYFFEHKESRETQNIILPIDFAWKAYVLTISGNHNK